MLCDLRFALCDRPSAGDSATDPSPRILKARRTLQSHTTNRRSAQTDIESRVRGPRCKLQNALRLAVFHLWPEGGHKSSTDEDLESVAGNLTSVHEQGHSLLKHWGENLAQLGDLQAH